MNKSQESRPTPRHVVEAMNVIAAYLRDAGYADMLLLPNGGATLTAIGVETHMEKMQKYLGWAEAIDGELTQAQAGYTALRDALENIATGEHRNPQFAQHCGCMTLYAREVLAAHPSIEADEEGPTVP